jgi:hypothetical protein
VDWCYSSSRGASGGILLMWDRRVVEKLKSVWGSLRLPAPLEMSKMVSLGPLWVYGPHSDCDRRYLWGELTGLIS